MQRKQLRTFYYLNCSFYELFPKFILLAFVHCYDLNVTEFTNCLYILKYIAAHKQNEFVYIVCKSTVLNCTILFCELFTQINLIVTGFENFLLHLRMFIKPNLFKFSWQNTSVCSDRCCLLNKFTASFSCTNLNMVSNSNSGPF